MNEKSLKELYLELTQKKLPAFSDEDFFDDWLMDLIQVDSFLAGMASSYLAGKKLTKDEIPEISDLEDEFYKLSKISNVKKVLIEECYSYLILLKNIRKKLLELIK